jgi:hypothetical protein
MHMAHLDAELLHFDIGVILVNRAQPLRENPFQLPLENPLPVLRNPHEVVVVVVRAVDTQPDLHPCSISQSPSSFAGQACRWGGFHSRAYARGPQPRT